MKDCNLECKGKIFWKRMWYNEEVDELCNWQIIWIVLNVYIILLDFLIYIFLFFCVWFFLYYYPTYLSSKPSFFYHHFTNYYYSYILIYSLPLHTKLFPSIFFPFLPPNNPTYTQHLLISSSFHVNLMKFNHSKTIVYNIILHKAILNLLLFYWSL
jgi:hypothetical protein